MGSMVKVAWVMCVLTACHAAPKPAVTPPPVVVTPPVDPNDPPAVFTAAETQTLEAMSFATLPPPLADITNRVADNPAAAALGQKLFSDVSFSGPLLDTDNDGSPGSNGQAGDTGKVSCASCHVPAGGFSDTRSFQRQISLGAGWGRRRAPSLVNVGQSRVLMWDGRHDTMYNQVFGPIETVVEMNSSRLFAAEQIYRSYQSEYEAIFGAMPPLADTSRFPALSAALTGCQPQNASSPEPTCDGTFHGQPGDQAEFDSMTAEDQNAVTLVIVNAGKAIGAFERQITCGPSAFDKWMQGDTTAMSNAAQRGAELFVGKGACVSCHSGPFFSDQQFHNVGIEPQIVQQAFIDQGDRGAGSGIALALTDPLNSAGAFSDGDDGRLPAATTARMEGAFRTPMLRCVSQRPTFMHTGQIGTLAKVVGFFNAGGQFSGYPGTSELHALSLTTQESADLVAFLGALDGTVNYPH